MTVSSRNVAQMHEIAALLRDNGVIVVDAPGWETRGQSGTFAPIRPLHHHDASTRLSGEWGAAGYIISARLAQWQGARCLDGVPKIMRCLAGVGWHAGVGGPYGAIPASSGNRYLMADEWANSGSEPYTEAAMYTRRIFSAAATEVLSDGALPGIGHKEWATPAGRKRDPEYDMDWFRRTVAAIDLTPPSGEDWFDMATKEELARVIDERLKYMLPRALGAAFTGQANAAFPTEKDFGSASWDARGSFLQRWLADAVSPGGVLHAHAEEATADGASRALQAWLAGAANRAFGANEVAEIQAVLDAGPLVARLDALAGDVAAVKAALLADTA